MKQCIVLCCVLLCCCLWCTAYAVERDDNGYIVGVFDESGKQIASEITADTALDPADPYTAAPDTAALLLQAQAQETSERSFLTTHFDDYTVTEGFCLLFLGLLFIAALWRMVKGVFY